MSSENTYPTRLRQLALVTTTPSLARSRHLLTHIFSTPVIFTDPAVNQWGLSNFLVPLGGDIIEVVAPLPSHPGTSTTAGRLLERRGEGGYMVIMQALNAEKRRAEVEGRGGKVIFSHPFAKSYDVEGWNGKGGVKDEGWCIQYHPKGMKGGMMPELDSHVVSKANKDPLGERFSPWHACGDDYGGYRRGMESTKGLWLVGCTLRLAPGDEDVEGAVDQWSSLFGVRRREGGRLAFSNCQMGFVKGVQGEKEGLASVTVGVEGQEQMKGIVERARNEGVWKGDERIKGDGWIEMVGVRWYLVPMKHGGSSNERAKL